jgi:glycosyltransferase 2 family protein
MSPQAPARRSFRIPKWLVPALGFAVSLVSLYFAFRKFDYSQLGRDVEHLIWPWVIAGVACELASYVIDAWRWNVILSPAEQPTLLQAVQATFIGLFANDVLPAKAGEIIRPYLLSRWAEVPLSLSITSAVMERLLDGIAMVTCFFLVSTGIPNLPRWLFDGMDTLATTVAIVTAVFLFVLFYKSHAHRLVKRNTWTAKFAKFLDELHLLGNWRTLGAAFAMSYAYFGCQFVAVFCLARAYNFDFGLKESAFVLLVVRLVTLIPNAPGNVGSFQLFCEFALRMLMVESFNAKSFAVIAYFFLTAPPLVVGAIAVMLTGLSLGEIHKQAHHAHREHAEQQQIAPGELPAA